jgi:hypothetical protein
MLVSACGGFINDAYLKLLDFDISDAVYHIEIVIRTQRMQRAAAEAQNQNRGQKDVITMLGGEENIEWADWNGE